MRLIRLTVLGFKARMIAQRSSYGSVIQECKVPEPDDWRVVQ